jgi:hypothetical protein
MSDQKTDDGGQRPALDPADAAARLAALLAKPLEPVAKSYDKPQDRPHEKPREAVVPHRDSPLARTEPWKTPAHPAASGHDARHPSPAGEPDHPRTTLKPDALPVAIEPNAPPETLEHEPTEEIPPAAQPVIDETPAHAPPAASEGPPDDAMAKLVAAMTKLVDEQVRHPGPRLPPEEPSAEAGEATGGLASAALAQEPVELADPAIATLPPDLTAAKPESGSRWPWFRRRSPAAFGDSEASMRRAPIEDAGIAPPSELPTELPPEAAANEPLTSPTEPAATPHELVADHPEPSSGQPEPLIVPLRPSARSAAEVAAEEAAKTDAGEKPADEPPLDPAAARIVRRVRRLMLISSLTTVIAVGAVFGVIGYRIYKSSDIVPPPPAPVILPVPVPVPSPPAAPTEVTLTLPQGARIIQTAVAEDRLVITLDIAGAIEIRTYDLKTLQPLARMNFATVP